MTRAVPSVRFSREALVPAPTSGIRLGVNDAGPVALRLFRLLGTRVAVAGLVEAAQLMAVRSASAGTPVQVLTSRPQLWEPLIRHSRSSRVVPVDEPVVAPGGPSLLVDDRPAQARGTAFDRSPWQCVVDVRGQWGTDDVVPLSYNDLTVFGAVPVQLLSTVASVYAIAQQEADRLAYIPPGSVAILRRGRVVPVQLDPSEAEFQLIEAARTSPSGPSAPVWRT